MQNPLKNIFDDLEVYIQYFFDSFDEKLDESVFHFDHQPDIAAEAQEKIDGTPSKDTLRHEKIPPPSHRCRRSPCSPICAIATISDSANRVVVSTALVRNTRRSIIEPVLASFELSSDSSDEEQLAPESLRPAREREQLRRIYLRNKGGLALRTSGVHICRDIGDESADGDPSTPGAMISVPSAEPSKQTRIKNHSRPTRARQPPLTRPQQPRRKPSKSLSPTNARPCYRHPLPSRRSPSRRRTGRRGRSHLLAIARRDSRRREEPVRDPVYRAKIAYIHFFFGIGSPRYGRL
ncbi:hypothetical protein EI94DRAFT_1750964 [Lactarius quietus]|nr:hypothetical protein EI94DRAFT_1750964 [Lactarius quietus]